METTNRTEYVEATKQRMSDHPVLAALIDPFALEAHLERYIEAYFAIMGDEMKNLSYTFAEDILDMINGKQLKHGMPRNGAVLAGMLVVVYSTVHKFNKELIEAEDARNG